MAENTDKDALKAAKDAEKAAKKAKQERIRQSKPKKDGNAFSRAGKAVKKFFKDFTGTCKKIVWPTGKQVVKNSLVVLATIIVIGAVVALIDFGLTKIFDLGEQGVVEQGVCQRKDCGKTHRDPDEDKQRFEKAVPFFLIHHAILRFSEQNFLRL